ncbi:MAG: hypothetical protein SX243_11935 [Acidobacteriota bacterium]|nr:hypothetical protein [Acidobacteriota bacterium]
MASTANGRAIDPSAAVNLAFQDHRSRMKARPLEGTGYEILLAAVGEQVTQNLHLRAFVIGHYRVGILTVPELAGPAVDSAGLSGQVAGEVVHEPSHGLGVGDEEQEMNVVAEDDRCNDLHAGPLGGAGEDGSCQLVELTVGGQEEAGLEAPVSDQDQGSTEGYESNRLFHDNSFHSWKRAKGVGIAHLFGKNGEFF